MNLISIAHFARDVWREFRADDVLNGAAAIAFFFLLSIFPAAVFLISLIPYLPVPHLDREIMELLYRALPEQAAALFEGAVREVVAQKKGSLVTLGLLMMLWSASKGIFAAMEQLNVAFNAKERRSFWKMRGTAILLMFLFLFLLISALSLVIFGGFIQGWLSALTGWSRPLLVFFSVLRWITIAAFLLFAFSSMYYLGPDISKKFRLITPGSLTAAVLIVCASLGIRFYISHFADYSATYGSLGAVIILMLWLYLAGITLLVGAEINAVAEKQSRANGFGRHAACAGPSAPASPDRLD